MVSTEASSAAPARHHEHEQEPLTLGLWLIILWKAITALLLWCAFVLLFIAHREDPRNFFGALIFRTFKGNPPDIAIRFLVTNIQFISSAMVTRIAVAIAAYAIVESAEAIGLLLRKGWAEWLVILVTVSFIPVEIFELIMRPNPLKAATLLANVVILWYLLKRLLDKRREHTAILHPS
ncbi:MAG TPA: DUF2127 domain-containing protein [Chloroflexota bacterium]